MTDPVDWPLLMRLGLGRLGLSADQFWNMTPRELEAALGPKAASGISRGAFDALRARFPDQET